MTDFFQQALGDVQGLEESLLGPDYEYYKFIKAPTKMGMGAKGNIKTLTKDIEGLIAYVELLVTGNTKASKTGKPLGDKFFLKTGAQCIDTKTNDKVTRYLYLNFVPTGEIPFISSGMGINFSEFEGLVPGAMGNLDNLNPMRLFSAFMAGSDPSCQSITMETVDENNKKGKETHYVTVDDIKNMNPCWFGKKNPVTNVKCSEAFQNMYDNYSDYSDYSKMPDDITIKLYYSALGILGLYILYRIIEKKSEVK